ncbi:HECT domain-containing protein [Metarhizium album ARSEF 1941]|uniref:HECT-type E3 ubiquitin transferase n=1 Tax=Metarhizium album (strain ARSEF 1941) TaxID=1081103 RepID=A0A0B2WQL3_METAS|nr:HECT domain-containing protein [Metarhizium album ARSEF 1941]KHN95939.1 HECT domain-containing protein [Metarhizium album ARSEF 1941]
MSALRHADAGHGVGADRDTSDNSHIANNSDLEAGLWQEAPFSRLPDDAPPELREFLQDVENPRRVWAIHRASRRHDFQLLVETYIAQLRTGCASPQCSTATCFTCRKRLAGKAPIRRFSATSARILAVYLASQDNPDRGLCPYLRRSNGPPPAVNNLIFSAQRPRSQTLAEPTPPKVAGSPGPRKTSVGAEAKPKHASSGRQCKVSIIESPGADPVKSEVQSLGCEDGAYKSTGRGQDRSDVGSGKVIITEKPVSRDYRSFAASTFGTIAFKMLEWLTPQGLRAISEQIHDASDPDSTLKQQQSKETMQEGTGVPSAPPPSLSQHSSSKSSTQALKAPELQQSHQALPEHAGRAAESTLPRDPPRRKRNSKGSLKTATTSKPQKKTSLKPLPPLASADAPKPAAKSSNFHGDKRPRGPKLTPSVVGRTVPEIPLKPAFFENIPCLSPSPVDEVDPTSSEQGESEKDSSARNTIAVATTRRRKQASQDHENAPAATDDCWKNYPLPQSLSQLNVELIDFICDIFQEDDTNEKQLFGPLSLTEHLPKPRNRSKRLARQRHNHQVKPAAVLSGKWRVFNEQTIFSVLSDPHSLVKSFTKDGRLYDSQTLWYCMLRMTRAAPSLVLHSLWLAAKSLFAPPMRLNSARLSSKRLMGEHQLPALTDYEAGCVMSICLHALVAVAPCTEDSWTMHEMSGIRSNGVVVAGAAARRILPMCLEYDDVFSNELALRLARRLFRAITARNCFAEIADWDGQVEEASFDVLSPLLHQIDVMRSGIRILEFTQDERLLHETRVPMLLLDWARAVLLQDWNGRTEYSHDGPFHGALSLMTTLYENRTMLLLGDIRFRVDYFSERLDSMDIPVLWADFTSNRHRHHLLDHPFLFSPETLVNFFRSINFSRMSKNFEESSSLKTRMTAIIDPGSLVTNTHHKHVLQDLLKTASSRFLVLAISREHVLRDAFDQLWRRQERELLRPLKVHLGEGAGGEEGFDSGGVQQEFFRMAISECLDTKYGAFTVDDRTRMAWFVPGSLVELWKFEMIGLLMSLAVYNGLTLPVTFPKALYRKLLGQPVDELYQIADGWPDLANGLTALQEWDEKDGLVEDVFARTYEFSVGAFGAAVTRPMTKEKSSWPQGIPPPPTRTGSAAPGDEAPLVTRENRDEYVRDYIRYLTDVSIRPQYRAFERGFRACLDAKSLTLLTPSILQSVVEGVQEIDISELRRYARYVGWDPSHHTVKDFWSIVKRYDDGMKRKLLEFVTASDRVPVGGMRNLQFIVQKNGEEEGSNGHLPTAYTCYGTLLLPEYRDKDVLRERLEMALENAKGFGFA